jgi:hypothetical protein
MAGEYVARDFDESGDLIHFSEVGYVLYAVRALR